eukprot:GFYU01014977.1.p1 GENE.GFYU01014977.1~~GFYU01014977.1.p1  ORF type:complete len:164 (-),score=32.40 GFYU01014977.1:220-711(-)
MDMDDDEQEALQSKLDKCAKMFAVEATNNYVDLYDCLKIFQDIGADTTHSDLLEAFVDVDTNKNGRLDIEEFLSLYKRCNSQSKIQNTDTETVSAFVALGGNPDMSGEIRADKLRDIVKFFGLTLNIEKLIEEADADGSGFIDYDEFYSMVNDNYESDEEDED